MADARSFPSTARTWIEARLDLGPEGRAEVNEHVMSLYSDPLAAWCRSTSFHRLGEPVELVQAFFADRLARPGFLQDWSKSELPLRRWLTNAFAFHVKEVARRQRRDGRAQELPEEVAANQASPEEAFDRAFALAIVRRALEVARAECARRGLAQHFELFHGHYWDERSYAELGEHHALPAERARVMSRTACQAFRAALRAILARDRGRTGPIDAEIADLLEVLE